MTLLFFAAFVFTGIALIKGVRRVVLTDTTIQVTFLRRKIECDLDQIRELSVKEFKQAAGPQKTSLYRIAFTPPSQKKIYFGVDGEIGKQMFERLKKLT